MDNTDLMTKLTKIVATIGPATDTEEILADLLKAGMNIARFNTKHSTPEWHEERINRVQIASEKTGIPVGVLLDLQGPEVRIDVPGEQSFGVKQDDIVTFSSNVQSGADNLIIIPQNVIETMSEDNLVLLDDGACEFIISKKGKDYFEATVIHDCKIGHRKTMNTPGVILDMPSLTERDLNYLDGVNLKNVDFVGLSFVRDKQDIDILKAELKKRGSEAQIIAKIENQAAIDNLDEIIENSDVVMVARGDLGVEVAFQELTHWQKVMIEKCRLAAKPVITATQMLKSMVTNPRPTRAEVSDVAHAIYDGTDAVMLSEETTIGEYPVRAVEVQAKIAEYNEPLTDCPITLGVDVTITEALTRSAFELLSHSQLNIEKIVCLSESGRTARLISRLRPKIEIVAVTTRDDTYRELNVSYGVAPHLVHVGHETKVTPEALTSFLKTEKIVRAGETILLIHGNGWKASGLNHTMSVVKIQ